MRGAGPGTKGVYHAASKTLDPGAAPVEGRTDAA